MRRGTRLLLILIILIVILSGVAYLFMNTDILSSMIGGQQPEEIPMTQVVTLARSVNAGDQVAADALTLVSMPTDKVSADLVVDPNLVVGKYAIVTLGQGVTITQNMVSDTPVRSSSNGQIDAASIVPPGLVGVAIPIQKLNSVGYGIQDGDHVNVIVTASFYDIDPEFQSKLPNHNTGVTSPSNDLGLRAEMVSQAGNGVDGRAEQDGNLNQNFYVVPSEQQRPRTVSQMVLQNVEVLHVGSFIDTRPPATRDENGNPIPQEPLIPDVITLIVSPQDAIALSYLLNQEVIFTLTLRSDDDTSTVAPLSTDLQYFLSQYNVVIPDKLPYLMDNNVYYPVTP